jgi:hypothetical protein
VNAATRIWRGAAFGDVSAHRVKPARTRDAVYIPHDGRIAVDDDATAPLDRVSLHSSAV